ncbi:protein MCM10-like protein isoform X1 [Huso huso]|uniref:Protein MCM10 homolog n=1 Tax=Huso huso TaxID=61971 RepID=A0ABR0ZCQ2_HUSHU
MKEAPLRTPKLLLWLGLGIGASFHCFFATAGLSGISNLLCASPLSILHSTMESDDDLDLLASLLEENEAAERGSLDCEKGDGDTDELDDLFDADDDGEEFDEGDGQEGEGVSEQVEDINTLFGDVEDLEEEEPAKEMTKTRPSSKENQDKSKQDLEAELRRMQEQMETLQKQLAVTQQALTSPPQKTPPNKQKQQPDKSTLITLKRNEAKKLQDSPCFSSQLNSSGLLKSKQRTAHDPKHLTTETKTPHQKSVGASPSSQPLRSSNKPNTALRSPPAAAVQSGTRGPTPSSSRVADQDVTVERFSGLRLRRPRVSSTEMERKMSDRKVIRLSQLPEKLAREKLDESDWVTFGVVVNKFTPQSSSSGKTFSIWRLTDLRNLDVYVSLFLFGDVHKEHWKTDPGTVIGILNPNPMKPKEGSDGVCLSVDHPQKVLLMGEAQDFGTCRAKKKNGDPCTQIVNLNECQFCQYHVKAQYKKLSSKRSELQSSFSGKVPGKQKGKGGSLKQRLCHDGFYYGGVSSAACAASLSASISKKPVQSTLSNLFVKGADSLAKEAQKKAMQSNQGPVCSDEFKNLMDVPTPGALNLKRHLTQASVGLNGKPVQTIQSISATQLLKQQKQQMLEARKKRSEDIQRRFLQNTGTPDCPATPTPGRSALASPRAAAEFPKDKKTTVTPLTPKLGRGFADGDDVLFFDGSPPPAPKPNLSAAKLAALKKLRAKEGGISKEDPNGVKRKRSDTSIKDVAERVEKSLASPETKVETDETEPASKKRREQLEYLQSAEFQEILNAKSRHTGAVKEAEVEIQERYFEPLVNKEQMEDKMRNIRELKCRAVTCKTCKYTYFKPLDKCVTEKHDYHWHEAVKRFFKCKCGQRETSLDRLPQKHCSNCGLFKWERDGMLREKKGPKIGAELLLTRGEEQPKFLNSLQ